jgi:hypothetical protein
MRSMHSNADTALAAMVSDQPLVWGMSTGPRKAGRPRSERHHLFTARSTTCACNPVSNRRNQPGFGLGKIGVKGSRVRRNRGLR